MLPGPNSRLGTLERIFVYGQPKGPQTILLDQKVSNRPAFGCLQRTRGYGGPLIFHPLK